MHHGYRPLSLLSRADAPRDSRGKYSTCHTFSISPFRSLPLSPSTPFSLLLLLVGVCLCCGFGLIPFVTLSPSKSQNIVVRLPVGPFPALCSRFSGWQLLVKSVSSSLWSPVDFVAILRQGLKVFSSDFLFSSGFLSGSRWLRCFFFISLVFIERSSVIMGSPVISVEQVLVMLLMLFVKPFLYFYRVFLLCL